MMYFPNKSGGKIFQRIPEIIISLKQGKHKEPIWMFEGISSP